MQIEQTNKTILIIDGNSLINRAYYAIRNPMITKEGVYTHGVYGFLNMLFKIIRMYKPTHIACTFDLKGPTFRHESYDLYKATRKGMPEELAMQMQPLKDILGALNISIFAVPGYEADDVIGTISKLAEMDGLSPLIVTGDKDALQLVSDKTKVLITKKGISEFDLYDPAKFIEKYGFLPIRLIDLKGLMGDSSDNIPGIPGVGEKTATKLLLDYGSLEEVLAHASELAGKLKEKVEDGAMSASMSKKLATIYREVPLELSFENLEVREPNLSELIDLYKKYEFNNFLKQLSSTSIGENTTNATVNTENDSVGATIGRPNTTETISSDKKLPTVKNRFIAGEDNGLDAFIAKIKSEIAGIDKENRVLALKMLTDYNHTNKPIIFGLGAYIGETYLYTSIGDNAQGLMSVLNIIAELIAKQDVKIITHSAGIMLYALFANMEKYGNTTAEDIKKIAKALFWDSAVCEYLLLEGGKPSDIKAISYKYFASELEDEFEYIKNHADQSFLVDSTNEEADYLQNYCLIIKRLYEAQSELLAGKEYEGLYRDIELPLVSILAGMEAAGFDLDEKLLREVGDRLKNEIDGLSADIYDLAGDTFNIKSPKQLGEVLFYKMQLPYFGKKGKTGYFTNVEVLTKIKDEHPIISKVLEYRTLTKLDSTYIEGLLPLSDEFGRVHTHFQQMVTATGRLSSTNPNLQNIPMRKEAGRQIRKAFVAGADNVLVSADYSQIELRIMAHLSGDPKMIEDFCDNADIHTRTASRVFDVPESEVTPLLRGRAKAVNFGIIYGMSSFGLSTDLDISIGEAEAYINEYFEEYQGVKAYLDQCVDIAKKTGSTTTLFGRKRIIPEINQSNRMVRSMGERFAMNTPIQGSAADIIKLAMVKVSKALANSKLDAELILQVHDELIIRCHKDAVTQVKTLITKEMEGACELKVPLIAEAKMAESWYGLK